MWIVIIFTVPGVFVILRDITNVTGNIFIETYNATGHTATGDYLRLIKNAVILRVPVQQAATFAQRRIPSYCSTATGLFIMQKCVCSIYMVESSIRFLSHGRQYVNHTYTVRHNEHLHF